MTDKKVPSMTYHIFYDTETTGPQPTFDQILQAAAILTDDDFQEIDTIDMRSRLAGHIIPTAGALKVTHIDPYGIARAPFGAYDFSRRLSNIFTGWSSKGETSFSGYNTIRFDEEIMRQMFWQSLQDPYLTSGKNKTRNDYLITMRALHARNPDVIEFPINPATGKKNFKLENIAPANGFAGHDAHDALGDVRATIFVAQLVRDVDPHLYAHMLAMGNANAAKTFVENEVVFQLLGGPMLDPGVLDVCLIGGEPTNPKNKAAWNLAIDPTPYLDLGPREILAAMRKTGTPFRTVKCNKQPGVFPMNWGFTNRVKTADYEPADQVTIDERAELIRSHAGFRAATEEALALKTAGYDAPVHLEEKIYSGFPSWDDKDRMRRFHTSPDWEARLAIVHEMEKPELRAHGLRTVFLNGPQALSRTLREQIDLRLTEERFTLETDRPWTTVGSLMAELDEMQGNAPDDEELANIRKWALETYPIARGWEDHLAALAARQEHGPDIPDPAVIAAEQVDGSQARETRETLPSTQDDIDEASVHPGAMARNSVMATSVNYLDGLD